MINLRTLRDGDRVRSLGTGCTKHGDVLKVSKVGRRLTVNCDQGSHLLHPDCKVDFELAE